MIEKNSYDYDGNIYEKVIKGLKSCSGTGKCYSGCPYNISEDITKCTSQLASEAIELLKKRETQIRELEEKLYILKYGDQDTLKNAMMPAT